jgi:hypothetical protein
MTMFRELLSELAGMFVADRWLSVALVALVGVVALLKTTGLSSLAAGAILLIGALAILFESVRRRARGPEAS